MALALWVFSLLGSACSASANIFGELRAQGRGAEGLEGALGAQFPCQLGSAPVPRGICDLIQSSQCPKKGFP